MSNKETVTVESLLEYWKEELYCYNNRKREYMPGELMDLFITHLASLPTPSSREEKEQPSGLCWVKASERLPIKDAPISLSTVKIRWYDTQEDLTGKIRQVFSDAIEIKRDGEKYQLIMFDRLEWLDETPPHTSTEKDGESKEDWEMKMYVNKLNE